MEYLGSLGRLVGLSCASTERVQATSRYVPEVTVEGRRRVQVRPASPRVWDVSVGVASPQEIAALAGFAIGAWGAGPWHWVPIQAHSGNLLTPREAMLVDRFTHASLTDAGPVLDASGAWSARSVGVSLSTGWVALFWEVPVVPGQPFTWSLDVDGTDPQVQVEFRDAAGGALSTHVGSGAGSGMQRVSVSATVPAGAVSAAVGVRSTVTKATRPQVSWTDGPVPWSPGYGCRAAVVDGLTEDLLIANRSGTYSNVSFTVMEVS